ncbi:hypothetical protein CISG_02618 [Coccidioides immitis RMSCC 3703]|uniref:Uncharacterized protein n=1 Tax=Coccidioides immitis RMSCC 3703 TaxID=454286 RepID=A0A0J8R8L9_COCIT|nr:hypothetical protein CISG_02618 [Coccidioides immitis RMSCC 3703]
MAEAADTEVQTTSLEPQARHIVYCGVTKNPAGGEEITVQGDVCEDVLEWLVEVHGKEVPEDNLEIVEDKKKKKAAAE